MEAITTNTQLLRNSIASALLLVTTFLFSCSSSLTFAQNYSTKNGKAIDLLKDAQEAPQKYMDKKTMQPNYAKGLELAEKALEKDPNFWEAHLLAGDLAEYANLPFKAIDHFRAAIKINPNHSPSGNTYVLLANLEQGVGEYQAAINSYTTYINNKSANPELVSRAKKSIDDCLFAIEAMKNPTDFTPVNVGPGINTKDPEYFPTITVDGRTLLFTRLLEDNNVEGPIKKQEDFFVSQLTDRNAWGTAAPMPKNINTIRNEGAPTIAADGRSLIFVACSYMDETDYGTNRSGKGSCDLFYTKRLGQRWTDPVNLPGNVNSGAWESQPSLSADGKTLYFVRGVRGRSAQRDNDIYYSTLQDDGKWGPAIRLPNTINTPETEESVLIHPDGKTLYFSSKGHKGLGGLDIFMSRLDDNGNWGTPINLGYPINTKFDENSLMVSADGEIAFFASDRDGGFGDLDIYYFIMPEKLRPIKTLYFDGKVFDATSKTPIAGKFSLIDLKTGKEVIRSEADPVTGLFTVSLPIDREYALKVSYPNYNNFSENFDMKNPDNLEVIHMDVPMVPISKPNVDVTLKNVFFDLGKATLRPESFIELNTLRDFLLTNAALKIELGGHTDTRGDAKENQVLSENRAKAVYDYLIKNGIQSTRLSFKGYGESMPIISDEAIAKLATDKEKEKAHQENRRTAYRVIQ